MMRAMSVVTAAYEAFARGDVPAVVGAMDPGIEWYAAEGNPYRSKDGAWVGPDAIVENVFMKLAGEWDGFALHPQSFHDAGDVVVVELRYSGTYKGTGAALDMAVCHVWNVSDGKLARFRQYLDSAHMRDVMGMRG